MTSGQHRIGLQVQVYYVQHSFFPFIPERLGKCFNFHMYTLSVLSTFSSMIPVVSAGLATDRVFGVCSLLSFYVQNESLRTTISMPCESIRAKSRVRVSLGQCRLWCFWKRFLKCSCDVIPRFLNLIMLLEQFCPY